tara:strand:+ start:1984 stop:3132 length:1149 start_codon:yes stop_codon:yes gene_type:complete
MAFLGNNFQWFVGVVEDRMDPEHLGRLRVRCLGLHTSNKGAIATADLPWASVSLPITASGISGLGQSPSFVVEGSWVWGYFRDELMQEMVIVGTLPGKPNELGNPDSGFYDPNRRSDDDTKEEYKISVYPKSIDEPDTNRLAVNNVEKMAVSLAARTLARLKDIPTADFDEIEPNITASDTDTWNQPLPHPYHIEDNPTGYNAVYPYNHVFESESGHIKEYDDSFTIDEDGIRHNHYRIHERHSSGTGYEILSNGDKVDLVTGSHYGVTNSDHKHYIQGNSDITINGRHKVFINKDGKENNNYDIQVGPNANVNIQVDNGNLNVVTKTGQFNFDVGADWNMNVGGNYNLNVLGNETKTVEGTTLHNTSGETTIIGRKIYLNQ